jgi:2-keto-4-pentenoate hydratase/2-oxohepta-3-ene-1,7-dioic acid hydratase in catechol pathway
MCRSARISSERGGTWDKGKGCDTFGPVGPWLVTPEDIYDVQDLDLYLELNGKRMQTGNTSTMIFTVAQIVSYLSKFMTLEPGDVIARHPAGRGQGRKPQRFLKKGDTLRLGIAGLGEQQAEVIAWQGTEVRVPASGGW